MFGKVTEIANSANIAGEGTTNQKTEFEVKIAISPAVDELRPGMTASADIIIGVKDAALGVPIQSVALRAVEQLRKEAEEANDDLTFEGDRDGFVEIVFVVAGEKVVARKIKSGLQSDDYIEIVSGLKEGEEIVTGSYRVISRDLKHAAEITVDNDGDPEE